MEGMRDSRFGKAVCSHPLVSILVVGLIVRAVISPIFTFSYDSMYWGVILGNIQSGEGLYGLPGYYYTPVWGYFLAVIGMFMTHVLGIGSLGLQADGLVGSQEAAWEYYSDLLTSPEFNLVMKAVFTLADLAISYLLYRIVMDRTGDKTKASIAFGLWFLCPIVIFTSCIQTMFDSMPVLLLVLTAYLLMRRSYFVAGMVFCMAGVMKLFPVYLIFLFVGYIVCQHIADRRACLSSIIQAVVGSALMLVVIYLPDILNGTFIDSLSFIFNRVGSIEGGEAQNAWGQLTSVGYGIVIILQPLIIALEIYIGYKMARYRGDDPDRTLIFFAMLAATCVFLWTPSPTYLLIIIPFLILHMVCTDRRYRVPYVLLAVLPMLYSVSMQNYSILFQADVFLGLVSDETILSGIAWLDSVGVLGISNQTILNLIFGALETIAIYSVFITMYVNHRRGRQVAETTC